MKIMTHVFCLVVLGCLLFINGCLTYEQSTWTFDCDTGRITLVFQDIRSSKSSDVEDDWKELKKLKEDLKDPQSPFKFNPEVFELITKELFEENSALSGRIILKVKSSEHFPSKAAIVTEFFRQEYPSVVSKGEIFLFIPIGEKIISSNAQIVETKHNHILIWPEDTVKFEIVGPGEGSGVGSLLPYYKKEREAFK
ncbi:MAG: hypothetical protein ACE144_00120 [Thermodesulfobacteriota bacterium]